MNFLHGVETIEITKGPRTITSVKTAVIGLVGIAPTGPKQVLTLVTNDTTAAQFGERLPGFNIPTALNAIFEQGTGTVLVVNVFNEFNHTEQVVDEEQTVDAGKIKLAYAPIGAVLIKDNTGNSTPYVLNIDYTIDPFGSFVVLSPVIADGTILQFSYKKLKPDTVTSSVIIGTVDPASNRTGIQCWSLGRNLFGYNPKILIAPGYSDILAVSVEMISQATKLKAIALLDAPLGTSVSQAISGRGPAGSINFNTTSNRAYLLYPHLKSYDPISDQYINSPFSSYMAGVLSSTDNNAGYWVSPSNQEIKGIVGAERNITAGISDAGSDANILNEAGITTIFNTFGTGIRTWGNRSAAFPTSALPDNFISVRRTMDMVEESLEQAALQFVDKPITTGLIDTIRESVNSFIRVLVQRGALVDGICSFDKAENPPTEVATGKLRFNLAVMPPPPAEWIIFNTFIDVNLLKILL